MDTRGLTPDPTPAGALPAPEDMCRIILCPCGRPAAWESIDPAELAEDGMPADACESIQRAFTPSAGRGPICSEAAVRIHITD